MTRSLIRLAAGAGAAIALLLAGGPGAAVTFADPGDREARSTSSSSGSSAHQRHPERADGRRAGHGHDRRRGPRADESRGHRRPTAAGRATDRGATSRGGPDGEDTSDVEVPVVADTSRVTGDTSDPASVRASSATVVEVSAPATAAPRGGTSSPRGTVGHVHGPIVVPLVTVGSGRPSVDSQAVPRPVQTPMPPSAAQVMPAAVSATPPPVTPGPPSPPAVPAAQHFELSVVEPLEVGPLWAPIRPGRPLGALFGIAGLVLAPIAGVWLGLRQARAAKLAAR